MRVPVAGRSSSFSSSGGTSRRRFLLDSEEKMKTFVILYLLAFLAAITGWILNIVHFVGEIGGPVTTMFIARIVGIVFAPLGAILGYVS
jgi:hypothetical protein